MRVDQIRQQVETATLAAVLAAANGGQASIPDLDQVLADFDTALCAPPKATGGHDHDLRRALGLKT